MNAVYNVHTSRCKASVNLLYFDQYQICLDTFIKGGYAHSNMHIFHF